MCQYVGKIYEVSMKKWLSEFVSDMRLIWTNFRTEMAEADIRERDDDFEDDAVQHGVNWNNVPDLDMRKSVNNLDNAYTREMRGTDF